MSATKPGDLPAPPEKPEKIPDTSSSSDSSSSSDEGEDSYKQVKPGEPGTENLNLGKKSCKCQCPKCGVTVMTLVKYTCTGQTHGAALGGALLDGGLISLPMVYGTTGTKDAHHTCPNCQADLGTYGPGEDKRKRKEKRKEEKKQKKQDKEKRKEDKKKAKSEKK